MNRRTPHWIALAALTLTASGAVAQDKQTKETADKLHAQALVEPNQGKQVELLCKAAEMVPKNADFQSDCKNRRAIIIADDQKALKTAQDANDAGQTDKAKRYAKYVTSVDQETYHQAQQLLAKLNGPPAGAAPAAPPPAAANQSAVQLAQATSAFDAGNLAAAKTSAQEVSDPSLKPAATRLLAEIDRYGSYVSAGQHHEEAKEYAQAERSYQSALELNARVGGDDLNGKIQRMHQLASVPAPSAPTQAAQAPVVAANAPPKAVAPAPPKAPPAQMSMEDKKKALQDAFKQALGRNDLEAEERSLREITQLDPHDADAKSRLTDVQAQLTAQLNRDPVKLEKTLREAIQAFYASDFEGAESDLNRYLGADGGKKKGAAYFYLGAIDETLALLDPPSKRSPRQKQARENFKQARSAGYQPVPKYVSAKILDAWQQAGM